MVTLTAERQRTAKGSAATSCKCRVQGGCYDKLLQLKVPSLVYKRSRGNMIHKCEIINKVIIMLLQTSSSSMQHGHATR